MTLKMPLSYGSIDRHKVRANVSLLVVICQRNFTNGSHMEIRSSFPTLTYMYEVMIPKRQPPEGVTNKRKCWIHSFSCQCATFMGVDGLGLKQWARWFFPCVYFQGCNVNSLSPTSCLLFSPLYTGTFNTSLLKAGSLRYGIKALSCIIRPS